MLMRQLQRRIMADNDQAPVERATRIGLGLRRWMVMSSGERIKVTVLDMSRQGVRLEVPEPVFVGETVELELGRSGYAKVTICWSRGSEAGGTFLDMD